MRDQAYELRRLKADYDRMLAKIKSEKPNEFLANIQRPSPFSACILVYPDKLQGFYPSITEWLPKISQSPQELYLWDQGSLVSKYIAEGSERNDLPFPILEKQDDLLDLPGKSDVEKLAFLRNINKNLDKHQEIWITIKSSEIQNYRYMIDSADSLCLMVPDHHESAIKCYEIIKQLYGMNCCLPIHLLEFSLNSTTSSSLTSIKIKNVAKQFLGIDLTPIGVVLSNNKYIPSINEGGEGVKISTASACGDFMYSFSKNIVYPMSGINQ